MAKKSIGSLMRKKLSDITNLQSQGQPKLPTQGEKPLDAFPTDNDCIQLLLKERVTLMQLLAERNEMIELSGAEVQRLRADIQKLQLQNWNLAQSNSHMLAELHLGRERIKALQHEILWRAALLRGKNTEFVGKVEMNYENNGSLSQAPVPELSPSEGDEKAGQPSPKASNDEQRCNMNRRRCTRRRSTGSCTPFKKNARKEKIQDKRTCLRRHGARFGTHEHEPLEDLFEREDAEYVVTQSKLLSSRDETGPTSSLGRPLPEAVKKVQSYRQIPLKAKLRRLEFKERAMVTSMLLEDEDPFAILSFRFET